jgi:putative ABC transport system ATP-binding protein
VAPVTARTVPPQRRTGAGLQAHELYRFFRAGHEEVLALRGVSLDAPAGTFLVISGPSGSGKSTLLSCLAGLDEPDGGTVRVGGVRISGRPETARTVLRRRHMGVLFQRRNLFDHLTVADNVRLARRIGSGAARRPVADLLGAVGIAERADAYPQQLSGGETARAGLAAAMANDPDVLIADEPTGELDGDTEAMLLDLLRAQAAAGTAVVVASHSPAAFAAADRVLRLRDGRVES